MENKVIQNKIEELRLALEQELPKTAVRFDVIFTADNTHQKITYENFEHLKKREISVRNIKGEWIDSI